MAALETQLVDPIELPVISEYRFSGDNRTVQSKCVFIEEYRRKATIFHAAQTARIARSTVYKWMDTDSEFAQAVADSFEDAADVMETSAYEDALGTPEKPGNALLKMFWLKAHRPKFRDRVAIDVEVVKDEIAQRLDQLGLRQLPVMTTSSVDGLIPVSQAIQSPQGKQFPDQPDQLQKEHPDNNSSSDS